MDGEEDENDEEEEYVGNLHSNDEQMQDIDDFENEDERDEIYRDLKNIVNSIICAYEYDNVKNMNMLKGIR